MAADSFLMYCGCEFIKQSLSIQKLYLSIWGGGNDLKKILSSWAVIIPSIIIAFIL